MSALYSPKEELANAVTHGLGALLSLIALVVMVGFSAKNGDVWHVISTSIYGTTLLFLYSASTLYHSIWHERTKEIFQRLDHAGIFLLIAGTYTPFTLVTLQGDVGWMLFAVVWGVAFAAMAMELNQKVRNEKVSLALYVGLGWVIVFAIKPLIQNLAAPGLWLLVAGGLSYTVGIVFYVRHSLAFHHAIWHLFVLVGSALHFFSIFFFVIP